MPINQAILQKRKALGLTQEQVADALGVTAPAVNKWEKGTTCPDLMLLPALARLLKTDLNTLLCFEENLTKQEIIRLLNEAAEKLRQEGYAQGFAWTMEKTREYPNCAELLHSAAMLLDGGLMMAALPESEKKKYGEEISALYEQVAQCGEPSLANRAQCMLASRLLRKGDCAGAQSLLNRLPERETPDKRNLQAQIWAKQGKPGEAAALLERKVLQSMQDDLVTLAELVKYEIEAGDAETASRLAAASQAECKAFGLWHLSACLVPEQAAVARKNVPAALASLTEMLAAVLEPWDIRRSPLCTRFPRKEQKENPGNLGLTMLPALLDDLEHNTDYDFLRNEPEFEKLLADYRAKCGVPMPRTENENLELRWNQR